MQKSNIKIPVGLVIVLFLGLLGFRDTGIFVNSFNAKLNNGVEYNFESNNRIEIIGEGTDKSTYLASKDGNEFSIPKAVLLKVDNGISGYRVIKNSPLYDNNGKVLRTLFLDEELKFVEDRGSKALVQTGIDNITGLIDKNHLDPIRIRNIVEATIIKDISVNSNGIKLDLKKDDLVRVAWFEKDYFIIFDSQGRKFNVPRDNISLYIEEAIPAVEVSKESTELRLENNKNAYNPDKVERRNETVDKIISRAESLIGSPYVWGDTGSVGYDCSGLVYSVYQDIAGIKLPRTSRDMSVHGQDISVYDLEPGDLLFFDSSSSSTISHVALYVGNGDMIHASTTKAEVVKDSIDGYYFQNRFVNARRVLDN